MSGRGRGRPPHPDTLTPAEQRVLEELRSGGTNVEIAVRLGLSPETVKTHIASMLAKLALSDRRELAAWRPERERRRLLGLLALPPALASLGRPFLWAAAALGGVAVVAVAVVLLVTFLGDEEEERMVLSHTLTATAGEGGSVTPDGTTTHGEGAEVALVASWNDATHSFSGWGGDCEGTASTCELTMDGPKTVTAMFVERCTTGATDPTCIRAVYLGAPGDYAQVSDIPTDLLLTPNSVGRYYVERGRQYTVVTAAPLPEGWTRFYLEQAPPPPDPVSASQLIAPVGTTYTFTVTTDPAASTLITFDLKQARPFVRPRPDGKPEIGDTVVTTVFSVVNCESGVAVPNPTTSTELVEDCESLLKARDRLTGTATLNWSVGRPMTNWEGVTVAGTPQRVTKLEVASSGLSGELTGLLGNLTGLTHLRLNANALAGRIPSKLQLLTALTHLYLANDALTDCVPASLRTVTNNDLAALNFPDCTPPRRVSDEPGVPLLDGGQTVSYQRLGRGPILVVDLPEGYTFTIRGAMTEGGPGRPSDVVAVVVTDEVRFVSE